MSDDFTRMSAKPIFLYNNHKYLMGMFMQITINLPQNKLSAFQSILDGFKEAKIITDFHIDNKQKELQKHGKAIEKALMDAKMGKGTQRGVIGEF